MSSADGTVRGGRSLENRSMSRLLGLGRPGQGTLNPLMKVCVGVLELWALSFRKPMLGPRPVMVISLGVLVWYGVYYDVYIPTMFGSFR